MLLVSDDDIFAVGQKLARGSHGARTSAPSR